jgi:phosphopantothenoylcysteine decarboxylase/phosphopantothenate--cysteine ligase
VRFREIIRLENGFDIVSALWAEVILVSGPTHLSVTNANIMLLRVVSAQQMYDACHQYCNQRLLFFNCSSCLLIIGRKNVCDQKLKKNDAEFSIKVRKNKDI